MRTVSHLARRFQFTLNEFDKYGQLSDAIKSKVNYKAMISCKETAPSTGHVHAHIYAMFSKPVRWTQVCGEHVEICKGSHKKNIEYICKNGDIIEKCNIEEARDTKMTAAEVLGMDYKTAKQTLSLSQFHMYRKLYTDSAPLTVEESYKPDVEVYYLYGPSGRGKTKYIYDKLIEKGYGKKYFDKVQYRNGFYVGQIGFSEEVCLLEEFRDSTMPASEFISFIDYYANPMNLKGGSRMNKYKLIFISSVQDPKEIYKNMDDEPRRQWMRRLKTIPFLGTN